MRAASDVLVSGTHSRLQLKRSASTADKPSSRNMAISTSSGRHSREDASLAVVVVVAPGLGEDMGRPAVRPALSGPVNEQASRLTGDSSAGDRHRHENISPRPPQPRTSNPTGTTKHQHPLATATVATTVSAVTASINCSKNGHNNRTVVNVISSQQELWKNTAGADFSRSHTKTPFPRLWLYRCSPT